MSTGYYLPVDKDTSQPTGQPLRHAHPCETHSNPFWHAASTAHPEDPTAHTLHDSWSPDCNWAQPNKALSGAIKQRLIREAYAAYRDGAPTPTFTLPKPQPEQTSSPSQLPSDVERRLYEVEELTKAAATTANAVADQADTLAAQVTRYDNRLTKLDDKVTELLDTKPRNVVYTINDASTNTSIKLEGYKHQDFDFTLKIVSKAKPNRRNFWLAGPAGSGKSTLVEQIASALGLADRFFPQPPVVNVMTQMIGYRDINSNLVRTDFREVFENGGVLLWDECDNSSPEAMIVMNQALANGVFGFPDKVVRRHPKCYLFAAANTMGAGSDAQYIRLKQDDAFMDRFFTIDMDYDEVLERAMCEEFAQEWVKVVQQVRAAARLAGGKAGFVISPRASEKGQDLLRGTPTDPPMSPAEVVRAIFGRYRKHNMWPVVGKAAEDFARKAPAPTAPRTANGKLSPIDFSTTRS